jgi:bifunctional polynucleotide phosphatase/kinase
MAVVLGTLPTTAQKWALFDLDWTLIRPVTTQTRPTLAGGPFCLQTNDWAFIPGRIERLQDFVREGWSLGIISNQKATGKRLETVNARMQNIYQALTQYFPQIVLLYSTEENVYRKPNIGWAQYLQFLPGSLYVGDACQDPTQPQRSWGYADSDRQFAANLGISFYTPEEAFPQLALPQGLFDIPKLVLILVGPPGSGKSTFARTHPDFIHIESDAYKSNWLRIEKAFRSALQQNAKIMIDATNPSRERRMQIIQIAREYQAPVGMILFLNSGKWNTRITPGCRTPVGKMAYNMFWSRFEEPCPSLEGNVPVYYQT